MRILVTGSGGLIGHDVVRACASSHVDVVPVVKAGSLEGIPGSLALDLREHSSVTAIVTARPDWIVHAAAVLPHTFDGSEAGTAAVQNRAIDDVVFEAASVLGCPLVFVSTASLYGCVQTSCSEDSPVAPRGPYGEEKYRSERRLLEQDARSVALRVSAPYGKRQKTMTVLRRFVEQALRGDDLSYYGTGSREQDFTAVEDISKAILAATRHARGGVFNIASGQPIAMKELAHLVIKTVGTEASRVQAAGKEDPEERCRARLAIAKAERELGWQPSIRLADGILRLASTSASA